MTRQFSVLSLFTLLLFTVSSGIIHSSSASLQTTMAAFAQTSSSSPSLADDIIDETSTSLQDSTCDDNVLEDSNEFGDEAAAIGQDNTKDQDTANVGLQEQDEAQEAANTNVDSDMQEGGQLVQPPATEPPTPEEDTTPLTLIVPEEMIVGTNSPDVAVVSFEVRALDNLDGTAILDENNNLLQDDVGGDIVIVCRPPSGSTFPLGETVVQCTVTDEAGNTARASFVITVVIGCEGVPATIVGTSGDDNLVGTEGPDVIAALAGDDEIDGTGGNDLICGQEGNDFMNGGTGNDNMFGNDGIDVMNGEAGDDTLDSVDGVVNNDELDGGTGTDTCSSDPDPEVNCNP
jgi:Ca2+-binding RTX toxin-like protein